MYLDRHFITELLVQLTPWYCHIWKTISSLHFDMFLHDLYELCCAGNYL